MIRINLLEETRNQVKSKSGAGSAGRPKMQFAENVGVFILLGGMALAAGGVAAWWMFLSTKISQLDSSIVEATEQKARLEHVLQRDKDLRQKKDDLTRKIGIIAELKRKQDLPVQLMALISENLAEFVWLEELTFTGELVTVRGKAQTPLAVANFFRNLEDSKFFLEVSMGQVKNEDNGLTTFEVTMKFNPTGLPPVEKPAGGTGAPGEARAPAT